MERAEHDDAVAGRGEIAGRAAGARDARCLQEHAALRRQASRERRGIESARRWRRSSTAGCSRVSPRRRRRRPCRRASRRPRACGRAPAARAALPRAPRRPAGCARRRGSTRLRRARSGSAQAAAPSSVRGRAPRHRVAVRAPGSRAAPRARRSPRPHCRTGPRPAARVVAVPRSASGGRGTTRPRPRARQQAAA